MLQRGKDSPRRISLTARSVHRIDGLFRAFCIAGEIVKSTLLRTETVLVIASVLVLSSVLFSVSPKAQAATSTYLNFQGRLLGSSGNLVADGTYNIQFNLYTVSSGGSTEWTETYLNTGTPVTIKNGYFSVQLGSLTSFPSTINWDQEHWLGMTVRGTGSCVFGSCTPADAEMTPRFQLTSVPFAKQAGTALGVTSNATATASTDSGNVVIQSGNATGATSNSGNITIDTGTATTTTGTLSLGATNASSLILGRAGLTTLNNGSLTVAQNLTIQGGTITAGTTGQAGSLIVSDGSSSTITFKTAAQVAATNYDISVPAITANDTFCLVTAANCAGLATTTLQQAYDNDANGSDTRVDLSANDDSLLISNPSSSGTDSTFVLKVEQLNTSALDALVVTNSGTGNILTLQDAGTTVLGVTDGGNLIAGNTATVTTATTSGTGTNTTTLTFTGTTSFANNDIILIDNAGQDYYTRIVSGGTAASVTVSPAITFETARTVTKYTAQNIGATSSDYTTLTNRFFQGYFLGGIVTGAGSTSYTDGLISSSPGLTINTTSATAEALKVSNGTSTGNIISLQDNGSNVFTVADGGVVSSTNNTTTGTGYAIQSNSLTTGTGISLSSTSSTASSANLVSVGHTSTYTSATSITGNLLNLSRTITSNDSGSASVTKGTTTAYANNTTSTSHTISYTVASQVNQILIVQIYSGVTPTSITYNGVPLTSYVSRFTTYYNGLWYLKNPTAGTANVVISSGSAFRMGAAVTNFYNVNQTTPLSGGVTTGGTSSGATLAGIVSATGDLVIDMYSQNANSAMNPGGGQTSYFSNTVNGIMGASASSEAGAASVTMSYSSSLVNYDYVAANIRSAGSLGVELNGALANLSSSCSSIAGNCYDVSNILKVNQNFTGSTGTALKVTSAGSGNAFDTSVTNTTGTQAAALSVDRDGVGGTTTSLLSLSNTNGTVTNGILFTGTITNDITTATNRALTVDSNGTGSITIGGGTGIKTIDLATGGTGAKTVTLGSTASSSALTLRSGTGNLNITTQGTGSLNVGNNAVAQTLNIGNTTGATALNLLTGSGNFSLDGVAASTYTIGSTTVAGTILIGGASQTGAITLGRSTASNTINIGNANTATGNTQAINIGAGTPAGTGVTNIAIGNSANGGSLTVRSGTGGITLNSGVNSNTSINTVGSTGTIAVGNSASTTTVLGVTTINTTGTAITGIGNSGAVTTLAGSSILLNSATLQRTSSGTTSLDLVDAANTTLAVINSNGSGVANLTVDGSGTFASNLTIQGGTVTAGAAAQAGSLVVSDGSSSTITIKSATQITATNYDVSVPAITASDTFCLVTLANCSGSSSTLQATYDGDADGSDSIITLSTADDSIILRNPSSSGSDSAYILTVEQLATGSYGGLDIQSAGTGSLLRIRDTAATAVDILTIADTGVTTFRNQTDNANAFQVKNAADSSVLNVDTTGPGTVSLFGDLSGDNSAWTANTVLPAGRHSPATVTVNGYIYVFGGYNFGAQTTSYYGKVNGAGGVTSWSTTTAMPAGRAYSSAVYSNGYIYIVGGSTDTGSSNDDDVYYAKVLADGTLGSWTTSPNLLPADRATHGSAFAYNGYMYVLGGDNDGGTAQTTSYYTKLNSDGSTGTWTTTTALSSARADYSLAIANGFVYVMGGRSAAPATTSTVYYAALNLDGTLGSWSTTTALPQTLECGSGAVSSGYIYFIGGADAADCNSNHNSNVYYAKANNDGTVGSWSTGSNTYGLGGRLLDHTSVTVNGIVYAIGGDGATDRVSYTRLGSTLRVGGNIDLVGLQVADQNTSGSGFEGSVGGSITAGNGTFVGSIQVQGIARLNQDLAVGGDLNLQGSMAINGNLLAQNNATSTTGTTTGTGSNTTTLTLTTDAFSVNDVVLIDNAGTDFYTRITVDPGTGSYTISPAVTFEASRTVTKYNIQNIGATATDYATHGNRFFQGYFLGGIVVGTNSTVYGDGEIRTTGSFKVQTTGGQELLNVNSTTYSLSVGNTTNTGSLILSDGSSNIVTVTSGSQSSNYSATIPTLGANDTFCFVTLANCSGGGGGTLQAAYNASSNPEFTVDATRGAVTIRDNSTPISGNLFEVQNNAGTVNYLSADATGVFVHGDLLMNNNSNHTIGVTATATPGTKDGSNVTLRAGVGGTTSGAGGILTLLGGNTTGNAAGGNVVITAGNGGALSTGGNVTISAGTGLTNGSITIGGSNNTVRTIVGGSGVTDGNIFRLQDSDGSCDYNPESGAVTVSCSSDERLKSNIVAHTGSLAYLMGFQIKDYTVNASGNLATGVIAQEVMLNHPELVTMGDDGFYKVAQLNTWILAGGIQDVAVKTTAVETRLDVLEQGNFQELSVDTNLAVGGNLTVAGTTTVSQLVVTTSANIKTLTVERIITAGDIPNIQKGAVLSALDDAQINGNDSAGTITLILDTLSTPVPGVLADLIFDKPYAATPRIVLTPTNEHAAGLAIYLEKSTTGFSLKSVDTLQPGRTYTFDYLVVQ